MSARVIRIAHPRNQGLVVVGLGRQDRGLPGDEFQKHDAEGVDVGPVGYLAGGGVLRRQVPGQEHELICYHHQ